MPAITQETTISPPRTIGEGLYDILDDPQEHLDMPIMCCKLRVAMSGVVFKLSAKGNEEYT